MDHNADVLKIDMNFKIPDIDDNMENFKFDVCRGAPVMLRSIRILILLRLATYRGPSNKKGGGGAEMHSDIKRSSCKAAGSNIQVLM